MLLPLLCATALAARLDSPVTDRLEALQRQALLHAPEARGAAALIRLRGLVDELDDLDPLATTFGSVSARRSTQEDVRNLARLFYADVERARGRAVKAQGVVDAMGFVQDWYAVGGFDNEGKGGCDIDYGPEAALDLRATYAAKGREVGWRKVSGKTPDGYVDLSVSLRPNTEAVAYALTFLQADQETRTTVSLGTSGGYRLFVNGVKVSSGDRYNLPRSDQARVQVTLRKGVNRVLVKVCQQSGPLGLYLRAERVEAAKGTLSVVLPDTVPPLERGSSPGAVAQQTLSDALAAKVRAAPNDAELRADWATVLWYQRSSDDREHQPAAESVRAADAKPDDASLQLIAASLQEDADVKRRLLERALKSQPSSPWARLDLVTLELNRDHHAPALAAAEKLLTEFPDFAPAHVAKVRALEGLGEKVAALRAAEDAFKRLPFVPSVAREAVAAARRAERTNDAIARARMAVGLRHDDLNSRKTLAGLLVDTGHVDDAAEQYRKVLTLDPYDVQTLLRLAELLSANGRLDQATSAFEQARRLAPDDPETYEREGRALLHNGQRDGALAALQRSLALRPQNPALKEMLRALRGDDEGGTAPWAFDATALAAEAVDTKGADAVYLADVTAMRVQTSGLSSRFTQTVVRVLTERGVEQFRQLPITWSPDRQEVRVLKARITKPDGSVVDSFGDNDRNLNEPWTGMYYDARARVLTFPALAPGDLLEVQYRLDDTSVENLLSDYWGDVDMVQSLFAKQHYRYVVDMPKDRRLFWNKASLPPWVKASQAAKADRLVYRFEAEGVARVVPEPQMPGWSEVATPLHVSTYETWAEVGRYYEGLVRDQLVPNDELKKAVEKALLGVDRRDESKVVAAIYGFVVTNTRYVALEFGIHGYKPYRVDRVLARRFGDCKDKAALINAMLKLAGVDARMVLLRMRHLGAMSGEPASLSAFNHAIAFVPSLNLFLDGTAEFHGSKELPTADRLANVLIIEPDGKSRFLTTPEATPDSNTTVMALEVALKPDGSATGVGTITALGQGAPEIRRAYQTPATRQSNFEQQWGSSFPGMTAQEVTVSDSRALEQPAVVSFRVAIPRYAESSPTSLRFYPFGAGRAFTQALAPLSERKWDVELSGVWLNRFAYSYTLPAGWEVGPLPEDVERESPFGVVRISAKKANGKLLVEGAMTLSRSRVTAAEYPAFRAWLLAVDQAFSAKLTVQRAGQTAQR